MIVMLQIATGTGILLLCFATHVGAMAYLIEKLRHSKPLAAPITTRSFLKTISWILAILVLSHTLHIYLWAASLWFLGALPGYEEPLYFMLVTYTTLGYGDITLDPGFRVLGSMAAVCGILMFGLTTGFLVGFFTKVLERLTH